MHRIALFIIITLIAEMAVSAFFHRNVSLLNQLVPPNDDFKKAFREGMFDKPNIAGFVQVTHYLLMIYDAERFRKLVEWPVLCKKTEAKYRNDVKENLNVIAVENPDIGFLNIVATYLHHANGEYGVISAPKSGLATDLTRTYLQQSKASFASNTLSRHRNCIQMERAVNFALEEEKEQLATIKTELFDKKQSVTKCITTAPVAASIKQCLKNVEDSEMRAGMTELRAVQTERRAPPSAVETELAALLSTVNLALASTKERVTRESARAARAAAPAARLLVPAARLEVPEARRARSVSPVSSDSQAAGPALVNSPMMDWRLRATSPAVRQARAVASSHEEAEAHPLQMSPMKKTVYFCTAGNCYYRSEDRSNVLRHMNSSTHRR